MARYIDADKFAERIKVSPAFRNINDGLWLQRVVIDLLNNAPTADVVPKSEVEELIKSVDDMLDLVCTMTGLELTYYGKYAELKKKYTEERK